MVAVGMQGLHTERKAVPAYLSAVWLGIHPSGRSSEEVHSRASSLPWGRTGSRLGHLVSQPTEILLHGCVCVHYSTPSGVVSIKPKQFTKGAPFSWITSAYCWRWFCRSQGISKLVNRCLCLFQNIWTVLLMSNDNADVGLPKNASKSHSRFGYENLRSTMHSASTRGQTQPFDACITAGSSNSAASITMSLLINLKFIQHWSSVSVSMLKRGHARS